MTAVAAWSVWYLLALAGVSALGLLPGYKNPAPRLWSANGPDRMVVEGERFPGQEGPEAPMLIEVQLRDLAAGDAVMVDGYRSRVTSVTHDRDARWVIVEAVDAQTGETYTVEGVPGDTIDYIAKDPT